MPSVPEIRKRMAQLGLWGRFVELRERYKLEGATPSQARARAYSELTGVKAVAVGVDANHQVVVLEGEEVRKKPSGKKAVEKKAKVEEVDFADMEVGDETAPEVEPEPRPHSLTMTGDDTLQERGRFQSKRISQNELAEWVISNLRMKGVRPEDAPNAEAWNYLQECRLNSEVRRDFLKMRMMKKDAEEESAKHLDDGRTNEELLDRLEHALSATGAEDFVREREVSEGGVEAGV